jgi:hypothetical protein
VEGLTATSSTCRRIAVAPGVEVLIDEQHPALRLNGDPGVIAEALRQALASVVGLDTSPLFAEDRRALIEPPWRSLEDEPEPLEQAPVSSDTPS